MQRCLINYCLTLAFILLLVFYLDIGVYKIKEINKHQKLKSDHFLKTVDSVEYKAYQSELQAGRAKFQRQSKEGVEIRWLWVSMSVCFSKNTQLHNKENYSYLAVTKYSVALWKKFAPDKTAFGVLVQVVYIKENASMSSLETYADTLKKAGALVRLVASVDGVDCPLHSQLARLFAFDDPNVENNDIVITVDANAFVLTKEVFNPILDYPGLLVWVYQYHDTAHNFKDDTFKQSLVAMRASTWKAVLGIRNYQNNFNLRQWLEGKKDAIGLNPKYTWNYDQIITTHGILKNKLCNVPANSGLWKANHLNFDSEFDDTNLCFHGFGYKDCNREIPVRYYGCKWWHFFPDQNLQEHAKKFDEIINNQ